MLPRPDQTPDCHWLSQILLPTFLLLFSTSLLAAEKPYPPETIPGAVIVSAEEVVELILARPELIIIDSRKKSEYTKGHIEGAVNLLNTAMRREDMASLSPEQDHADRFLLQWHPLPAKRRCDQQGHGLGLPQCLLAARRLEGMDRQAPARHHRLGLHDTPPHLMRIEALSIRNVTVIIFVMIGLVASILSLLAGNYFRQAALDAQINSLSRVIEVASQEMLKTVRGHTFDLGMRLTHSDEIIQAIRNIDQPGGHDHLVSLLDDPFINGFVGFANINLEKIRVYDLNLKFVAESAKGITGLDKKLDGHLAQILAQRPGVERLKAVDALWLSPREPLYSTLVPIGGLRLIGYLEIIINPVFNLPDIGAITQTPISIFSPAGEPIIVGVPDQPDSHLPVEYMLFTSDNQPAFRIVGYENVEKLNAEMERTRTVTISSFLLLTISTLLFALWLFNRFLFEPVARMIQDMKQMASGKLDLTVNKKGLRDFSVLAETFNSMADQVRRRTNDLERLLDLDDSAILCFGNDQEAVYFNRGAAALFGYAPDEIGDLDLNDLFGDDIAGLVKDSSPSVPIQQQNAIASHLHPQGRHPLRARCRDPLAGHAGRPGAGNRAECHSGNQRIPVSGDGRLQFPAQ